ncbi:MAG: hypothetical protein CVU89_13135 [Firmicutes bacterium HGW-Firmicutes-14]|nr:MAG: hypothetical protein CVU89_13135 [Firmicutes bacterium HGW-Firmicutes-14]
MSKLEELKKFIDETVTPDDLIIAILSNIKHDYIPKDPGIIHRAIFELKQKEEFNELLDEFSFDTSGILPFSDLLDTVLFRLETSCILGTLNPRYEKYELSKEKKEQLFKRTSEKLSAKLPIIAELSGQFEALVCMQN